MCCNILVVRVAQFGRSRQTLLDCMMPSSPDTLQELLTEFTSMAWSTASEPTLLGLFKR